METNQHTGNRGEAIAVSILRKQGFEIAAQNWRHGKLGEIDIVARHAGLRLLNFVEVKTRKSNLFGDPVEAITPKKQAQLISLSEAYLAAHPELTDHDIRFDIIGIYFPGHNRPAEISHIENALQL